jgi:hypothetical protein
VDFHDMAPSEQGRGTAWHVWINAWHGRGIAWARHAMCESALTAPCPVKKFNTFYRTWTYTATFTTACHLSLSWARWTQFIPI